MNPAKTLGRWVDQCSLHAAAAHQTY